MILFCDTVNGVIKIGSTIFYNKEIHLREDYIRPIQTTN